MESTPSRWGGTNQPRDEKRPCRFRRSSTYTVVSGNGFCLRSESRLIYNTFNEDNGPRVNCYSRNEMSYGIDDKFGHNSWSSMEIQLINGSENNIHKKLRPPAGNHSVLKNPTILSSVCIQPLHNGRAIYRLDACYDRGSTFCLKIFLNDRASQTEIVGNPISRRNSVQCMLRPWYCSSGGT